MEIPSTSISSANRWRGSTWAWLPLYLPPSWAAIRSPWAPLLSRRKSGLAALLNEGILFAYGATEPEAGSDLGALRTTAERVEKDGHIVGYKINGNKQWISNGGIADAYTVLANTPAGPSWFIVDKGASGFSHDKPEDKHGIRLSNTAALAFNDVYVDADRLIGGVEGQGLLQAQAVFGYTRLMVAAFGLGAGWSALDRAIPYSTTRIQAGAPLSEKQGYTHKLIVPNVVRLEASRACIEEIAERIDAGEGSSEHRRRDSQIHGDRGRQFSLPTPAFRPLAATATPTSTWWRRSAATCASPPFTKAPPRSWR